jgi:hypothetical protein
VRRRAHHVGVITPISAACRGSEMPLTTQPSATPFLVWWCIGAAFHREPCAPGLHGFSGKTAASAMGSSSRPGPSKPTVPPPKPGGRKAAAEGRAVETKCGDEDELPVISEPHEMFWDMVRSASCR